MVGRHQRTCDSMSILARVAYRWHMMDAISSAVLWTDKQRGNGPPDDPRCACCVQLLHEDRHLEERRAASSRTHLLPQRSSIACKRRVEDE